MAHSGITLWQAALDNYEYNVVVLVSAVAFFGVYCTSGFLCRSLFGDYYSNIPIKTRVDLTSRVPATVHALLMIVLSTYALVAEHQLKEDLVWGDSIVANTSCAIVTGYMVFDFLLMMWHFKHIGEVGFIFHHFATMFAYLTVTHYHVFEYCAMWRLVAEYSTPFLHIRVFLDELHLRSSKRYFVNGLLFVVTFLGSRIFTMPYYYYVVYSMHGTDSFASAGAFRYVLYVSCFVLDSLNSYWAVKVVRGFLKTLRALRAGSGRRDSTGGKSSARENGHNGISQLHHHSVFTVEATGETEVVHKRLTTGQTSTVHQNGAAKKVD